MHNNKELYTFLLDHSAEISTTWAKSFNDEWVSLFSTDDSVQLSKITYQNQLFIIHLSKVFLVEQGLFFSSLDSWIKQVAGKLHGKKASIHQVIVELRRIRMIFWEAIGEFVQLNDKKVAHKEILLWSDLVYIAFEEIIESFLQYYKQADRERVQDEATMNEDIPTQATLLKEGLGLVSLYPNKDQKYSAVFLRETLISCRKKEIHTLIIDLSNFDVIEKSDAERIYQLCSSLNAVSISYYLSGLTETLKEDARHLNEGLEDLVIYPDVLSALKVCCL